MIIIVIIIIFVDPTFQEIDHLLGISLRVPNNIYNFCRKYFRCGMNYINIVNVGTKSYEKKFVEKIVDSDAVFSLNEKKYRRWIRS